MAFDDYLPANSESRCLSIMMKLLKNKRIILNGSYLMQMAHNVRWKHLQSNRFHLVDIKKNTSMWKMPNGDVVCSLVFFFNPSFQVMAMDKSKKYGKVGEYKTWSSTRYLNHIGAKPIPGFN